MEPDAHPDRTRREARQRIRGSRERSRRGREGDEEGVSLRVDLDPAVRCERLAQNAAMLGERLRVVLRAQLVQQPRRALDVGEEEGDGAGGEVVPHAP